MNLFIYWFIYSFFGFIIETLYTSIPKRKWQDRGFLAMPIIPIYGFGAMAIILILKPYVDNVYLLFILSFLLTSLLEYITSYVMEKTFHMRWWDYSERKFNIRGRVCLLNSTLFAILSVILLFYIHPIIIKFIDNFSVEIIYYSSIILFVLVMIDFIMAVRVSLEYSKISLELSNISVLIEKYKDKAHDRLEVLYDRITNYEHRLLKAYPLIREDIHSRIEDIREEMRIEIRNTLNRRNR